MIQYEDILLEPVLSEKANQMREEGKYVFKVDPKATKPQIKEAVKRLFNVNPVSCTTMVVGGKAETPTLQKGIYRNLEEGDCPASQRRKNFDL